MQVNNHAHKACHLHLINNTLALGEIFKKMSAATRTFPKILKYIHNEINHEHSTLNTTDYILYVLNIFIYICTYIDV